MSEKTPSEGQQGVARAHSANEKPAAAFAVALHRENQFGIDDGDWRRKRKLTAVVLVFTLQRPGGA
jgi:hypothetical protein